MEISIEALVGMIAVIVALPSAILVFWHFACCYRNRRSGYGKNSLLFPNGEERSRRIRIEQ
jgi:hypothetical protein